MAKQSAGILLYRQSGNDTGVVKVLLVHPGGPFWAKKDAGAWSAPKGEVDDGEQLLAAAKREFAEEVGSPLKTGKSIALGQSKLSSGKLVYLWAINQDFDTSTLSSNQFQMEWPPKSGQKQSFAEVDRAEWFELTEAITKINAGQVVFIERLAKKLNVDLKALPKGKVKIKLQQTSLF